MKTITLKEAYAKATKGPLELMAVGSTFKLCTSEAESFVDRHHYLAGSPFVAELNDDFSGDEQHGKSRYEPIRDKAVLRANAALLSHAFNVLPEVVEAVVEYLESRRTCKNKVSAKHKLDVALTKANQVQIPETT